MLSNILGSTITDKKIDELDLDIKCSEVSNIGRIECPFALTRNDLTCLRGCLLGEQIPYTAIRFILCLPMHYICSFGCNHHIAWEKPYLRRPQRVKRCDSPLPVHVPFGHDIKICSGKCTVSGTYPVGTAI